LSELKKRERWKGRTFELHIITTTDRICKVCKVRKLRDDEVKGEALARHNMK